MRFKEFSKKLRENFEPHTEKPALLRKEIAQQLNKARKHNNQAEIKRLSDLLLQLGGGKFAVDIRGNAVSENAAEPDDLLDPIFFQGNVDIGSLSLDAFKVVDPDKTLLFAFSNTLKFIPAGYFTGPNSRNSIAELFKKFGKPTFIYLNGTGLLSFLVSDERNKHIGQAIVEFRSPQDPYNRYNKEPTIRADIKSENEQSIVALCRAVLKNSPPANTFRVEIQDPSFANFCGRTSSPTKLVNFESHSEFFGETQAQAQRKYRRARELAKRMYSRGSIQFFVLDFDPYVGEAKHDEPKSHQPEKHGKHLSRNIRENKIKITEVLLENQAPPLDGTYVDIGSLSLESFKVVDPDKTLLFAFSNLDKGIFPLTLKFIPAGYFTGPNSRNSIAELSKKFGKPTFICLNGTGTLSCLIKSYDDLDNRNLSLGQAIVEFRSPQDPYSGEPNISADIDSENEQSIVALCRAVLKNSPPANTFRVEIQDPSSNSFFSLNNTKLVNFTPSRREVAQTPGKQSPQKNLASRGSNSSYDGEDDYEQAMQLAKDGDFKNAIELFKKASKDSNVTAQAYYAVGLCYFNMDNFKQTAKYWSEAAKSYEVDALFGMGILYSQGQGVQQDNEAAAKYYVTAARYGNADAALNAGNMFADNRLYYPPYAIYMYLLAEKLGNDQAGEYADELIAENPELYDSKEYMEEVGHRLDDEYFILNPGVG